MNWKFISVLLLITILIFYIIFYPLQFDFYEDLKAKKISDFIIIPLYGILIMYDISWNIKKGEKNWRKYILDFLKHTGIFSVMYFFIIRRFFSCLLIFVNGVFGEVEAVNISGVVVGKIDSKGSGKNIGNYELTIEKNGNELIFDSNHKTVKNYEIGENFEMKMKKGILNIIFK